MGAVAAGLTEATMAQGGFGSLANDILLRPVQSPATAKPALTKPPTPTAAPSPSATPPPSVSPAEKPGPSATTNSFVHLRAGKSTSAAIIIDLSSGTVVQLLPDSDAQWQQVRYNGANGYIFKTYLTY